METTAALCGCGCGSEIPWRQHHKYQPARFIRGHRARLPYIGKRGRKRVAPPEGFARTGVCACGCGEPTTIADSTGHGDFIGLPRRYVVGHHMKGRTAERSNAWDGGRWMNQNGYWLVRLPGHHLAYSTGYVPEHRLVWEQTHGRRLRHDEHVHHIDGDRGNNAPVNLVAMDASEHARLHRQEEACGKRHRKKPGEKR